MIYVYTFGDFSCRVFGDIGRLVKRTVMFSEYLLEIEDDTYMVRVYHGLLGVLGLFDIRAWRNDKWDQLYEAIRYVPNVKELLMCYTYYGSEVHRKLMERGAKKYVYGVTPVIYCEVDNVGLIAYTEDHKEKGLRYLQPKVNLKVVGDGRVLEYLQ